MQAGDLISQRTGLRSAVMHISALTATTRAHHAARHGLIYTMEDQISWWNEGANRINCKCSINTVLITKSGKAVDAESQQAVKSEGKQFFG